ncbi:ABC transporter ATP-binding protein [Cycloclasticus sp. PY97N]|nr:ABC transporter ATP-binding protein [Cycloclasticus sp. PY97N]
MNDLTCITVSNLSKCYNISHSHLSKILCMFFSSYKKGIKELWAVKDVSFSVSKGESIAIIGRNGDGKSTLLELLTGTRKPTSGTIKIEGKIAALLQLGSGFNLDYTGIENIYFNGLLFGLTRSQIKNKLEEIIAFSGIGNAVNQPIKEYSSGMKARLAFSVQIALEPDILIIDEALSVGDSFFQDKCKEHLKKLQKNGTTILLVTHNMSSIDGFCDRAIVLNKGTLVFDGSPKQAIEFYRSKTTKPQKNSNPWE